MKPTVCIAPSAVASVLRREFFARAGAVAMRYGIDPDDVLCFCEGHAPVGIELDSAHDGRRGGRKTSPPRWGSSPLHVTRLIAHLDDLVHVVACVRGSANAWADLADSYEPALIHAARDRLDGVGAVVGVRRWFAALRAITIGMTDDASVHVPGLRHDVAVPTLRDYRGFRPLRHWLAERLLGELSRQPSVATTRRLRLTSPGVGAILKASQRSPRGERPLAAHPAPEPVTGTLDGRLSAR